MNQKDFDEIKAFCEKKGLEYEILPLGISITGKKDIWEGVEFVENVYSGTIYPCKGIINYRNPCNWRPSIEEAYEVQLKAEAFKRFGDIQEGDLFKGLSKNRQQIAYTRVNKEWDYLKSEDQLFFYNVEVYNSGKWATKAPKRVEVEFSEHSACGNSDFHSHLFTLNVSRNSDQFDREKAGKFIASQFEKFLNNEI